MTGAVALAVILVIVVGSLSMAFKANQAGTPGRPGMPGMPGRPTAPRPGPTVRAPRRPSRPGASRREEAKAPVPPKPPEQPSPRIEPQPDLLSTGRSSQAKVITVVDERTVGTTTRSRITLRVEPDGEDPFEAQMRVLFPSPEKRASVKVGGIVAVRFDPDNHNKIVLDLPGGLE